MGKKYKYADEKSIQEVDDVLNLAAQVIGSNSVVIKDKRIVPPIVGAALAGAGGAAAAGLGGAGIAGAGAAALAAGSTVAAASLAIVAAPAILLGGIGFLIFKNKKEKKLHGMRLARYKEAVEKQNKAIKKFVELDKKREENEKKLHEENEELRKANTELRNKLNELRAINEALVKIIDGLGRDLQAA